MSKYYGDIDEDATIELAFNTFNSDGASVTVTDLATTDVEISKDGTVLGDPDAGVTLSLNHSGDTGAHLVIVDTSADAQYTTGSNYEVKLIGITVDSQIINAFIGSFSIENRFMRGTDDANITVPDAAGVVPTAVENRQEMDSNSTRLDANISSRAPSGEYNTQLDANVSTRAPASEYDTEMARITADVATEAKQDIIDTVVDAILNLLEGDEKLDYGQTPARRIIFLKGTATEILKKQLKQIDGVSNITAVTQTIGKSEDEAV
jgi:hypothetical protein